MDYNIKLESFEGPLDLLLHLISNAKINIKDISITDITEQYLDYLDRMREFDIEIASEFLVMAANLLYIKSRSILPKPTVLEDEIDPEEELRLRLIEYNRYKKVSKALAEVGNIYSKVYYKLPEELLIKDCKNSPTLLEWDPRALSDIFKKLLDKNLAQNTKPMVYRIGKRAISVEQRIQDLKTILQDRPECSFFMLFDEDCDKGHIVVTFLALLEMLRVNQVVLYQKKQFQDIIIRRVM